MSLLSAVQTWGIRPFVGIYFIALLMFGAFFMLQVSESEAGSVDGRVHDG